MMIVVVLMLVGDDDANDGDKDGMVTAMIK